MTAAEARVLALAAIVLIVAGGVWLFGPYALLAAGVVLLAAALLGPLDEGRERREPSPEAVARQRR